MASSGASTMTGTFCDKTSSGVNAERSNGEKCSTTASIKPIDTPIAKPEKMMSDVDEVCIHKIGQLLTSAAKTTVGPGNMPGEYQPARYTPSHASRNSTTAA